MQTQLEIVPQKTRFSIQTASPELRAALPSAVAERTGSSRELVSLVSKAVLEQVRIRAMLVENEAHAIALLAAELQVRAKQYTGCVKTDDMVFDECVEFVIERFGGLHIDEIRHAFRLAASGELGEVSLDAYFGTFTVAMLGKVLIAYEEYRKKIGKAVMEAERKAGFAESQVLKSTNWDSEQWARGRMSFFMSGREIAVDDVSVADFKYFVDGKFDFPQSEKREDWQKAWDLSIADVQASIGRGEVGMSVLLNKVQDGGHDEGFRDKRIKYYKRLLVLRWAKTTQSVHS